MKATTLRYVLIYAAFLAVVFVAELATRPVATDDGLSYFQVRDKSLPQLLDSFKAGVNVLPYAYFVGLWGLDRVLGLGPVTVRLLSLAFMLAAVVFFHRILRARFGDAIAFVACVAVLLLPKDIVRFAHDARPYSLYLVAGAFCLAAGVKILEADADNRRTFLLGAAAAFALPAVHYVGGFYSLGVLIALLYAKRRRGQPLARTAASFVTGWLAFAAVHFQQLRMFGQKQSIIDPNWIPRPTADEVLELGARLVMLPAVVCVVLIAMVALASRTATRPAPSPLTLDERSIRSFLVVVSLLWIVIPPVFYFIALVGGMNVALQRYFTPSQLATGFIAALVLTSLVPPAQRLFGPVTVAVAAVFLAFPTLVAGYHVVKAPAYVWRPAGDPGCLKDGAPVPCLTNNLPLFVQRTFYREGPPVILLRKTEREVEGFKRFDRHLPMMTASDLPRLDRFRFLHQKGTVNSFPDFDIRAWGKANGYEIVEAEQRGGVTVFDARRS